MLLDYLIENGADVNRVNCKGYTPLVVCITHCREASVLAMEKLVRAGAAYNIGLDGVFKGLTPLDVAMKCNNDEAVAYIQQLIANEHSEKTVENTLEEVLPPKNKAQCPICKTLVRYPTQMCRLLEHQEQVEDDYREFGVYGRKKKKKTKVYTSRRYLDQFLTHNGGDTWKKLCGIEFHAMENMKLRKEISESFALLHAVQECHDRLTDTFNICQPITSDNNDNTLDLKNIFMIDLCSGKGITSALASALFPHGGNHFLSIDKMNAHTVPHYFFLDEERISYMSRDIFNKRMLGQLQDLVQKHTNKGRTTILVGMHCCGILSERVIEIFESIPEIQGIVLSPCCLPKSHELKKELSQFTPPTQKGEDPFPSWCQHLKRRVETTLSKGTDHVRMYNDLEMHTQKNYMIVGTRKCLL